MNSAEVPAAIRWTRAPGTTSENIGPRLRSLRHLDIEYSSPFASSDRRFTTSSGAGDFGAGSEQARRFERIGRGGAEPEHVNFILHAMLWQCLWLGESSLLRVTAFPITRGRVAYILFWYGEEGEVLARCLAKVANEELTIGKPQSAATGVLWPSALGTPGRSRLEEITSGKARR